MLKNFAVKILILLIIASLPFTAGENKRKDISGKVIGVTDGDTIELLIGRESVKVRLNGIDCPEKKQAFGQKAKQFTSDMVYRKTVTVAVSGKDRYGRILGDVTVEGKSLNKALVENGFAWHFKKYSDDQVLANLEIKARNNRVGLWSDKNPMAPWDFRKSKRK